jgi:hypothetical protein
VGALLLREKSTTTTAIYPAPIGSWWWKGVERGFGDWAQRLLVDAGFAQGFDASSDCQQQPAVSARVGGGVDVIVSLGLLDAFDQRVFEGLEGPAGAIGQAGWCCC